MKLMIVDDSTIVRKVIEKFLKAHFPDVELVAEASNGVEGLRLFEEKQPDIVTMDITMPEMDGIVCMQKMLKLNPRANIVVISSLSDKDTMMEAEQKGAIGFLDKPITEDKMRELLDKVKDRMASG